MYIAQLTHIKQYWGLLLAHLVRATPSLQLEASLTLRVSATPGTLGQTEARVHSAVSTSTKRKQGLPLAFLVRATRSLQLEALLTLRVSATPVSRG